MLADQLTEVLIAAGVERIYGVVGDRVTDPLALSIPPRITAEQVKGFALSGGRPCSAAAWGRCFSWRVRTCATSPRSPNARGSR